MRPQIQQKGIRMMQSYEKAHLTQYQNPEYDNEDILALIPKINQMEGIKGFSFNEPVRINLLEKILFVFYTNLQNSMGYVRLYETSVVFIKDSQRKEQQKDFWVFAFQQKKKTKFSVSQENARKLQAKFSEMFVPKYNINEIYRLESNRSRSFLGISSGIAVKHSGSSPRTKYFYTRYNHQDIKKIKIHNEVQQKIIKYETVRNKERSHLKNISSKDFESRIFPKIYDIFVNETTTDIVQQYCGVPLDKHFDRIRKDPHYKVQTEYNIASAILYKLVILVQYATQNDCVIVDLQMKNILCTSQNEVKLSLSTKIVQSQNKDDIQASKIKGFYSVSSFFYKLFPKRNNHTEAQQFSAGLFLRFQKLNQALKMLAESGRSKNLDDKVFLDQLFLQLSWETPEQEKENEMKAQAPLKDFQDNLLQQQQQQYQQKQDQEALNGQQNINENNEQRQMQEEGIEMMSNYQKAHLTQYRNQQQDNKQEIVALVSKLNKRTNFEGHSFAEPVTLNYFQKILFAFYKNLLPTVAYVNLLECSVQFIVNQKQPTHFKGFWLFAFKQKKKTQFLLNYIHAKRLDERLSEMLAPRYNIRDKYDLLQCLKNNVNGVTSGTARKKIKAKQRNCFYTRYLHQDNKNIKIHQKVLQKITKFEKFKKRQKSPQKINSFRKEDPIEVFPKIYDIFVNETTTDIVQQYCGMSLDLRIQEMRKNPTHTKQIDYKKALLVTQKLARLIVKVTDSGFVISNLQVKNILCNEQYQIKFSLSTIINQSKTRGDCQQSRIEAFHNGYVILSELFPKKADLKLNQFYSQYSKRKLQSNQFQAQYFNEALEFMRTSKRGFSGRQFRSDRMSTLSKKEVKKEEKDMGDQRVLVKEEYIPPQNVAPNLDENLLTNQNNQEEKVKIQNQMVDQNSQKEREPNCYIPSNANEFSASNSFPFVFQNYFNPFYSPFCPLPLPISSSFYPHPLPVPFPEPIIDNSHHNFRFNQLSGSLNHMEERVKEQNQDKDDELRNSQKYQQDKQKMEKPFDRK